MSLILTFATCWINFFLFNLFVRTTGGMGEWYTGTWLDYSQQESPSYQQMWHFLTAGSFLLWRNMTTTDTKIIF